MGNDSDRFTDPTFNKFVRTKFRVGNDGVPIVGSISKAANPTIRIHWRITNELKLALLVQVLDLLVLCVDDPHVVDGEHNVGLFTFNDLADALLTEGRSLEPV